MSVMSLLFSILPKERGTYQDYHAQYGTSDSKAEIEAKAVDEVTHHWCKKSRGLNIAKEE